MIEVVGANLLDHLLEGGPTARFSIIGLCKNAGKTVTLNHIIRAAAARQVPLGLISTGRDGEEQDAITELPKPRIYAPAGAWIATAQGALDAATARILVQQELPFRTRFGPLLIGRVEEAGEVLLIGPGSASRIGEALYTLEAHGAQLCLVDGSFDRISAAAPSITGRAVMAVGAAYSANMSETVEQVRHLLDVFDLLPVPVTLQPAVRAAMSLASVCLAAANEGAVPILAQSALSDPEPIVAAMAERQGSGAALVLTGALSDRLLEALVRRRLRDQVIVVTDSTHILVDRHLWHRFRRLGGEGYVSHPIRLMALTTNPYSPVSVDYDATQFFEAIRTIAQRPVFDLQAGLF